MSRNKILVTSETGSLLPLQLVQEILQHSGQEDRATSLVGLNVQEQGGLIVPWNVSTKYYSTVLDFWLLASGMWDPSETADEAGNDNRVEPDMALERNEEKDQNDILEATMSAGDWELVGSAIDAIALVVDRKQPPAPSFLASWAAFAERFDPAIQICVGYNETGTEDEDPHQIHEWCLSNGFEYIRLASSETAAREEEEEGGEGRELFGVARVIEALQSHTWDNTDSGAASLGGLAGGREFLDRDQIRDLLDLDPAQGSNLPSQEEIEAMHRSIFGGIDEEDGFEATVDRLQKLREAGRNLPSEERHTLAAQVGLAFLKQFESDLAE